MSLARWVTTASRICRLYIATAQPTGELQSLTKFALACYAPTWFRIKCRPRCTDGPKHLLQQIKIQRQLSPDIASITLPVIKKTVTGLTKKICYWQCWQTMMEENRKDAIDT